MRLRWGVRWGGRVLRAPAGRHFSRTEREQHVSTTRVLSTHVSTTRVLSTHVVSLSERIGQEGTGEGEGRGPRPSGQPRGEGRRRARRCVRTCRDETCPISTGGGTRRVRLVRRGGAGGGGGAYDWAACSARTHLRGVRRAHGPAQRGAEPAVLIKPGGGEWEKGCQTSHARTPFRADRRSCRF